MLVDSGTDINLIYWGTYCRGQGGYAGWEWWCKIACLCQIASHGMTRPCLVGSGAAADWQCHLVEECEGSSTTTMGIFITGVEPHCCYQWISGKMNGCPWRIWVVLTKWDTITPSS